MWVKKGLIYPHSATTPVPILLNKSTIRVYAGFRDKSGVSRIGYVDVNAKNPGIIRRVSKKPVLDIGQPGTFDDNGVILGDVVRVGNTFRMYYVGFQHVQKIKFMAFAGLAESRDGETFTRVRETPILDRIPGARFIRAIHSVMKDGNVWKIWTGEGDSWEFINGKPYPCYAIYYYESKDGITFMGTRKLAVDTKGKEYRIGRPRVYKTTSGYEMYYTAGTRDKKFYPGYAVSRDGIHWKRKDAEIALGDILYPAIIKYHHTTYMFYNTKNFGAGGFGYATL